MRKSSEAPTPRNFLHSLFIFICTIITLAGRIIYAGSQTYFGMKSTGDYLGISGRPTGKAYNMIAVTGTVISTILGKTAATWKLFDTSTRKNTPQTVLKRPLGWLAWGSKLTLDSSALFYGFTNSIAGYFGTVFFGRESFGNSKKTTIITQTTATGVALTAGASYIGYDFARIRENSSIIAEAIDARRCPRDKAMLYTLATAAFIIPTYVGSAYFWAEPSIRSLPGTINLPKGVIDMAVTLSCITTFFTVLVWLPSIYMYFAHSAHQDPSSPAEARAIIPRTCFSLTLQIAAYTAGMIDSLGGNGFGPFISVVRSLADLLDSNPYGWIIGYALACGLFAALTNFLFSVVPGLYEAEQMIYARPAPLPSVSSEPDIEAATELMAPIHQTELAAAEPNPVGYGTALQNGLTLFSSEPKIIKLTNSMDEAPATSRP